MLDEIRFDDHLRKVIMGCVNSVKMSLMWNEGKREEFVPSRGLRQGDSLFSYLFVLRMKKLTHLIVDCVNNR